jgi:hypothetical protein
MCSISTKDLEISFAIAYCSDFLVPLEISKKVIAAEAKIPTVAILDARSTGSTISIEHSIGTTN